MPRLLAVADLCHNAQAHNPPAELLPRLELLVLQPLPEFAVLGRIGAGSTQLVPGLELLEFGLFLRQGGRRR